MRRLLWPATVVVAFLVGWAVADVARRGPSATTGVSEETVKGLQAQVMTLQARLHARETAPAHTQAGWEATSSTQSRRGSFSSSNRFLGAATVPDERLLTEGFPGRGAGASPNGSPGDRAGARTSRGTNTSGATVETALQRFYSYLEATNGTEGRERWQRARELANELRGMGDAAGQALMQVLAAGNDSEERRAAANLIGNLQVAQALPVLRDIIDKDQDLLLRRAAASALRQLQTPESIPVMEQLLGQPGEDRFIRLSAAYGLAESGRPMGVAGLTQIFDEATADGRGRDMAFRALASLKDERPLPFMRQVAGSPVEPTYRLQAIRYLSTQGDRSALGVLQGVMQSPTEQPSIRDAAAQAYSSINSR